MNAQFQTTHERLDKIEVQTSKTNGRVTDLECWKGTHVGEETGIVKQEKRQGIAKNLTTERILTIIGFIILITIAIWNHSTSSDTNKEVRNLGEPIIVNKSGKPVDSRGLEVHYFGKKDSVK